MKLACLILRAVRALLGTILLGYTVLAIGEPSLVGQADLINMPDARIDPDGTFNFGYSYFKPYRSIWTSLSVLPRIEVYGRYTSVLGVPGFGAGDQRNATFGSFKDKSVDIKALLLKETDYLPALAIGAQDFIGTGVFSGQFVTLSKHLDDFDLTLGYGKKRIDGLFGGVRYSPSFLSNFSLVAEYDANNYSRDVGANLSGAAKYKKSAAYGIEYKWKWLGAQIAYAHGQPLFNGYVSVPLNLKEFVPKVDEPEPFYKVLPRPSSAQWNIDPEHKKRMVEALFEQDFRHIHIDFSGNTLDARLTNSRISKVSRAVGRAARILLAFAPLETREIKITYLVNELPVTTYSFFDLNMLQRYFNGMALRSKLSEYVSIDYANPHAADMERDKDEALAESERTPVPFALRYNDEGDVFSLRAEDSLLNRLRVRPFFGTYLNDPSGAFHYEIGALASWDQRLGRGLYFDTTAQLIALEDVSKVTQPSNSLLPHVRSDIADYRRNHPFKLTRVLLNQYFEPEERIYARASAGIYEEMFAGVGGQVLILPRSGPWAADVSLDWVRQRDTVGFFGFRSYQTVTPIGSVHYRLPFHMTATLRGGRFLAKDAGARFELKRRFQSGIEAGFWYTLTNGNDITSPGTPSRPYHDKGLYVSIPLGSLLTKDTQALGTYTLAPWTRDVGQMVVSPGDLYTLMEKPAMIDMHDRDGLVMFGDREDDYNLPSLGTSVLDRPLMKIARDDWSHAVDVLGSVDTWEKVGLGAGLIASSAALDHIAFRAADKHRENSILKASIKAGNALPVALLAGSGLIALGDFEPRISNTALASIQAGVVGLGLNQAIKFAVGRSRPTDSLGNTNFHPFSASNLHSSFTSNHTTAMWAAITPYAKEYEMPWLYGVAAFTNLARVGSREHWVSDTVASSLLGYAVGSLFWQWRRTADDASPQFVVIPNGVGISWKTH